ncbi:deoxyribonuclease IV [Allofustis seminis]|uniref:deoxyribonuclease IV n=1 Tax=Allofustis seminis TaxID=166939 RepID=UPI00037792B8|nr:deoxyribonuclease IV [Allofustis seminis]
MVLLGSHVSMKAPDFYLGSAREAVGYGENTFMIYTGAPQNTRRRPIEEMKVPEALAFMDENNIDVDHIVIHAPYIVNLGNTNKKSTYEFGVQFLKEEIKRAEAMGATQMTLHPGAHVGAGAAKGIAQIAKGLNEVLRADQTVQIALETMAGKGTEIGRTFEELRAIIDQVDLKDKLSVTMDTCHIHDAGYNVKEDFDGVLEQFDRIIGLDYLKVIHVNDSKNIRGAHKDRHANIGFGEIGFDALNYVVHHKQLKDLPKILETPFVGEDKNNKKPPYKFEIEMLREQIFNPNLLEDVMNQ